jgi:hypothetical protein
MKRPTKRSSNSKGVSDEIAASRSRIQAIITKQILLIYKRLLHREGDCPRYSIRLVSRNQN